MSEDTGSIIRILTGSSIIFVGQVLHKVIAFAGSVFVARILGDTGYGIVALVLALYFLGTNILTFGLNRGIARNYPQTSLPAERRGILVTSYYVTGCAAVGVAAALFVSAGIIAETIFREPALTPVLRVIAIAIPLNVLSKISQGAIQAIKEPTAKVAIQSVINPVIRFAGIVIFVLVGFDAAGVAGAYAVAAGVTAILSAYVVIKRTELLDFEISASTQYRSLLSFSIPLMGSAVLLMLMNNVDTLLLGVYKSPDVVGQYNVAFTFSQVTLLFYLSLGFMYIPELSELVEEGRISRAKNIFQSMTKWIFVISLPFILTALVFPRYVITFIYSDIYGPATVPFVILIAGFLTHLLAGQNSNTLTALGNTRVIFAIDTGTIIVNIALNIVLITRFGMIGAATATASSYVLRNVAMSSYLYRIHGFQPFGLRLLFVSVPICTIALGVRLLAPPPTFLFVVASTMVFIVATAFSYLAFGIEPEDVMIASAIEERSGLNLDLFRHLHSRLNK